PIVGEGPLLQSSQKWRNGIRKRPVPHKLSEAVRAIRVGSQFHQWKESVLMAALALILENPLARAGFRLVDRSEHVRRPLRWRQLARQLLQPVHIREPQR